MKRYLAAVFIVIATLNASTYHGIQPVVVKNNVDVRATAASMPRL